MHVGAEEVVAENEVGSEGLAAMLGGRERFDNVAVNAVAMAMKMKMKGE